MKKRIKFNKKLVKFFFGTLTAAMVSFAIYMLFVFVQKPKSAPKTNISQQLTTQASPSVPQPQSPTVSTSEEILVGALLGLSGWIKEMDTKTLEGLQLRFDRFNQTQEIKNKKIKLVYADHEYNPQIALAQMQKLYNDYKVNMFIRVVGTDMVKECLPFINEKNIQLIFPSVTFSFAKPEDQKNLIYLKSHLENEAIALTRYAFKKNSIKKFAFFYQNDEFGIGLLHAAIKELTKNNIEKTNWIEISQKTGNADASAAAEKINEFNPDCILFFASSVPVMSLLSKINILKIKYYFGTSSLEVKAFQDFISSKGISLIKSHVFPNMKDKSIEISKEYLADLDKKQLSPEGYSFAAYVSASVFIDALTQIDGPITTEKIITKLKSIKNYKFKGLNLDYSQTSKTLCNDLWIETETGEWIYSPVKEEVVKTTEATEPELKIGTSLDLSAGAIDIDLKMLDMLKLRINQANLKNELPYKINLISTNHQCEPRFALANLKKLFTDEKISIYINFTGTDMIKACIQYINDNNLLFLFPSAASSAFNKEKNIIFSKGSFENEVTVLVNHAVKAMSATSICILYQNDDFGKNLLITILDNLTKIKFPEKRILKVAYERNTTNTKELVKSIKEFSPDCLFLLSFPSATVSLFQNLDASVSKFIMGTSVLNTANFINTIKNRGLKIIRTHIAPNPYDTKLEIVRDYQQDLKATEKNLDEYAEDYAFQSYIDASLMIHILKQITQPITTDKISAKLTSLKNYNFKGLNLTFNEQTRHLCNYVWLENERGEWIYSPVQEEIASNEKKN